MPIHQGRKPRGVRGGIPVFWVVLFQPEFGHGASTIRKRSYQVRNRGSVSLSLSTRRIKCSWGQGRFAVGGLPDDLQPECVEGAGGDLVTVDPQGMQTILDPLFKFLCRVSIESKQQDFLLRTRFRCRAYAVLATMVGVLLYPAEPMTCTLLPKQITARACSWVKGERSRRSNKSAHDSSSNPCDLRSTPQCTVPGRCSITGLLSGLCCSRAAMFSARSGSRRRLPNS